VQDTSSFAVGPDSRLWFGLGGGGVRSLDPGQITWSEAEPEPTATVPAPTATPVPARPTAAPCTQTLSQQDKSLATIPRLGCPQGAERQIGMARQRFEHAEMIWRSDERSIVVLYDDGTWQSYADRYQDGQPESDPALEAPQGLLQPARGFGKLWREQLGGPQARAGWATAKEQGTNGTVQTWEGGFVLRFGPSDNYAILQDGTWY
jgi:hypothetical protein